MSLSEKSKRILTVRETVLFAMLGTLMFTSKILLEILPNIHLLAAFTTVYTVVFRKKALIPIYVYVLLNGLWAGFAMWWIPHTYLWTVLWAVVMLLPQNMPKRIAPILQRYPVCSRTSDREFTAPTTRTGCRNMRSRKSLLIPLLAGGVAVAVLPVEVTPIPACRNFS